MKCECAVFVVRLRSVPEQRAKGLLYRRDYSAPRHPHARWGVGESQAQPPLVLRGCLRGMPYPAGTLIGSSAPTAGVALGACPDPDTLVRGRRSVISRGLDLCSFWPSLQPHHLHDQPRNSGLAFSLSDSCGCLSSHFVFASSRFDRSSRSHGSRATQCLRRRLCQL